MKLSTFSLLLMIGFRMTSAAGADVGYELPLDRLDTPADAESTEFLGIEFEDRTWAVPGVEQSETPLPPPQKYDFQSRKPRFHLECVDKRHRSYLSAHRPYRSFWLEDVAWPRTREMFTPWNAPSGNNSHDVYVFGGITFQR